MDAEWKWHTYSDRDLIVKNRVREIDGDGPPQQGAKQPANSRPFSSPAAKPAKVPPPKFGGQGAPPRPQAPSFPQGAPWALLTGGVLTGVITFIGRARKKRRPPRDQETSNEQPPPGQTHGDAVALGDAVQAQGRPQPADVGAQKPPRAKRPKTGSKARSQGGPLLQAAGQNGIAATHIQPPQGNNGSGSEREPSPGLLSGSEQPAQAPPRTAASRPLGHVDGTPPPAPQDETPTSPAGRQVDDPRAKETADPTGAGDRRNEASPGVNGTAPGAPAPPGGGRDAVHSLQLELRSKDSTILDMQVQLSEREHLVARHTARVKELEALLGSVSGSPSPQRSGGQNGPEAGPQGDGADGFYGDAADGAAAPVGQQPNVKQRRQPLLELLRETENELKALQSAKEMGEEAIAAAQLPGRPATAVDPARRAGQGTDSESSEHEVERRHVALDSQDSQRGGPHARHVTGLHGSSGAPAGKANHRGGANEKGTGPPPRALHRTEAPELGAEGAGLDAQKYSLPHVRRSLVDSLGRLQLDEERRHVSRRDQGYGAKATWPLGSEKGQPGGELANGVAEEDKQEPERGTNGGNGSASDMFAELQQEVEELSQSLQKKYQLAAAKSQEATEIVTELQKHDMTADDLEREFADGFADEDFEEEVEGERDWRQLTEGLGTNSLANEVEIQELTAKLEKVAAAQRVEEDLAELAAHEGKIAELKRRVERLSAVENGQLAPDGTPVPRSRSSHASLGSQLARKLDVQVEQARKTSRELQRLSASLQISSPGAHESKKEGLRGVQDASAGQPSREDSWGPHRAISGRSHSEKLGSRASAAGEADAAGAKLLREEEPSPGLTGLHRQLSGPLKSGSPPKGHRPRHTEEDLRLSRLGRQLIDPSRSPLYKESSARLLLPLPEEPHPPGGRHVSAPRATSPEQGPEEAPHGPEALPSTGGQQQHPQLRATQEEEGGADEVASSTGRQHGVSRSEAEGAAEQTEEGGDEGEPMAQSQEVVPNPGTGGAGAGERPIGLDGEADADAGLEELLDDVADDMFRVCSSHSTPAKVLWPSSSSPAATQISPMDGPLVPRV